MSNTEIQGRPVSPFETWTYEIGMSVFEGLAQDSSMPPLSESQRDSLVRQIQRAILDYWPPPQITELAAFGEHQCEREMERLRLEGRIRAKPTDLEAENARLRAALDRHTKFRHECIELVRDARFALMQGDYVFKQATDTQIDAWLKRVDGPKLTGGNTSEPQPLGDAINDKAEILALREQVAALESREVCTVAHDNVEECGFCQRDRLLTALREVMPLLAECDCIYSDREDMLCPCKAARAAIARSACEAEGREGTSLE